MSDDEDVGVSRALQRRPAGQSDGAGEFPRDNSSRSASPAAVAELDRSRDVMKALIAVLLACASASAADLVTTGQTNGLRASLHFTDSQVFGARTNGFGLPQFTRISKVSRGVWFAPALVFSGPGLRADGGADISFGVVVRKPDGTVIQELDGMTVTKAHFTESDRALHLARDTQGICIGPEEPAGTYTVVATLKDQVKKVSLTLQREFTIEK